MTYHYEELTKPSWYRQTVPMSFMGAASRTVLLMPAGHPRLDQDQGVFIPTPAGIRARFMGEFAGFLGMTPSGLEGRKDPEINLEESVELPLPAMLRNKLEEGLAACAFDESAGRLIVAPMRSSQFHIIDYADPT
jgi:hypothetical protein